MSPPPPEDPNRTGPHTPGPITFPGAAPPATEPATSGTILPVGTQPGPHGSDRPEVPGYVVTAEIARGGMGRVFAARDTTLDREVAIKVVLPGADDRRFVTESKVTARLPHPNVPPVHQLGVLPDGSHFLAMKLVRGATLADLLKATTPDDWPRLVQVFEQVCQAVGFAHSKGIIHRDLKPANVMVGAFGEVQVMDWGLAKLLRNPESRMQDEGTEPGVPMPHAEFRTPNSDETRPGALMGTPAYMAPEQARGEVVDARADVFALGGILATVLTGRPPFRGDTARDTLARAAVGGVGEVMAALDACGGDRELSGLAKRCLSPEPDDRPDDGKAVADAVAAYRAGVEERLRKAERDRAAAEAQAVEQRKRRRVQLALGACVALLVAAGGAFGWWQDRRDRDQARLEAEAATEQARLDAARAKAEAERESTARQNRTGVRATLALATDLRTQYRFAAAADALGKAAALAAGADDLLAELERAAADLAFVRELDAIQMRKSRFIPELGGKGRYDREAAPPGYRAAFLARGFDLARDDPGAIADRLNASAVRRELIDALDDWAVWEPDPGTRDRILAALRRADPGPWLDRSRDPAVRADRKQCEALLDLEQMRAVPVGALVAFIEHLGRYDAANSVWLGTYCNLNPLNFRVAFLLGEVHARGDPARAVGYYRAARALRPDELTVTVNLASALQEVGDKHAAFELYRKALEQEPENLYIVYGFGVAMHESGELKLAAAMYQKVIQLDPTHAQARNNLGVILEAEGDRTGAIAQFRESIRLNPTLRQPRANLGTILMKTGDVDGAALAFTVALRLDPTSTDAHVGLGLVWELKGHPDRAVLEYREAIRCDPKNAKAHELLGIVLAQGGELREGVGALREAVRLDPNGAEKHYSLGVALRMMGDANGELAAYSEAVRIDPTHAGAHYNLGLMLLNRGRPKDALHHLDAAVRTDPMHHKAFHALARARRDLGDLKGAVAAFGEAAKLSPDDASYHTDLAVTLFATADRVAAVESFRRAVRADPSELKWHVNLALALRATGDKNGAAAEFREVVKVDPKSASAHSNLGGALFEAGRLDDAIAAYREAIRLDPTLPPAWFNLGEALHARGDLKGAGAAFAEAVRIHPGYAEAHVSLGVVRLESGDIAGARAAWAKAAQLDRGLEPLLKRLPPVPLAPPPRVAAGK